MAAATIPCRFLAIAEMGGLIGSASTRNGAAILRTNDFLTVFLNSSLAALEAEENQTDYQYFSDTEKGGKGPYSAVVTNRVSGTESRVWVKIPAHDSEIGFDLLIAVCNRREDIATVSEFARQSPVALPAMAAVVSRAKGDSPVAGVFLPDQSFVDRPGGDESYRVEHFPIPKEVRLMVGGMDFMPDGELAISTMPGEIYLVEGVTGKPADARWRRFARGLNEPLGLKVVNGEIYVTQKCELTRVVDTDGNGEADFFECISASWGYNGNYHSFATGPVVDAAGNFFVMVAGHRTVYENPYMGWCLKVTPGATSSWLQGTRVTEGYCSGLRVPNGFGSYQGEVFMTDNQGHWIAANKLNHLQPGKYYGHPSAKPAPQSQFNGDPDFQPPAVWFPYSWVRSASGFATIPDDRFGPFKGQLLVGEFQNASVVRVMLEKVGGEWQGAVFPFINGFNSGVNRLAFGPDGKLYAGGLRMGHWTSIAPQPHSLDRVEFTGLDPFEIKEVHARASGFELVFTEPLEPGAAAKAETYDASQYHYAYDGHHNAPEKDRDEKIPSQTPTLVTKAELSSDHLRVRLHLDGFQPGYVTVVRCLDVRNAKGKKLRHDTFHYTLNRIPAE
jgi:glucose/arabinose dehydrogenase